MISGPSIQKIEIQFCDYKPHGFRGRVLRGGAIVCDSGERVIVQGKNLSGKTTLAHAICVNSRPEYSGQNHSAFSVKPHLGFAYQGVLYLPEDTELALTSDTVLEELSFSIRCSSISREYGEDRLAAAIEMFNLSSLLGRRISTLSGGQKQRVLIAALVACFPRLLLTDDYTTNLDPVGSKEATRLIAENVCALGGSWLEFSRRAEHGATGIRTVEIIDGAIAQNRNSGPAEKVHGCDPRAKWDWSIFAASPFEKMRSYVAKNLSHAYTDSAFTLTVPMLELRPGITAFIGKNGCGKSTLIRLLCGLIPTRAGEIRIDGRAHLSRELQTRAGLVLQEPKHHFVSRNVRAELAHAANAGNFAERRNDPIDLAGALGLGPFLDHEPDICPPSIQRRIAIALAILKGSAIMFFDEPTIGQDDENVEMLASLFRSLADSGRRIVLVSHDLAFLGQLHGRALALREGMIVQELSLEDLRLSSANKTFLQWYA